MKKFICSFQELTNDQLYDLLKLRQDVFVIEQDCIYQDVDGYDKKAIHFLIYQNGVLAAYSRIFAPGIKYETDSSIGRIIVSKQFRGKDVGSTLISESINYISETYPQSIIRIEAQALLENYYSDFGFKTQSGIYAVDGIDHIEMTYDAKNLL